jgi:glucose/arabinose dehydrogenase
MARAGHAAIVGEWVVRGVHQPVSFDFDPRGRIWFVEKALGDVQVFDPRTGTTHRFFHVSDLITDAEEGLDGIALDPRFPRTPSVYLFATRMVLGRPTDQILRVTAGPSGSRQVDVIYASRASPLHQHSGGRLIFGPDGMLYVTIGDASDAGAAQDLASTRGKILRLTPDGEAAPGNPSGSRVWASGIRNSFGLAFDPATGNLWETENGPECNDELNRIVRGGNYGWGPAADCGSETPPSDTNRDGPNPILPLRWFTPTIAPTGVAFCDGCALGPHSVGALFFGTYNTGELWRVELSSDRAHVRRCEVVASPGDLLLSLEVGPDGAIYFSTYLGILRLVRSSA